VERDRSGLHLGQQAGPAADEGADRRSEAVMEGGVERSLEQPAAGVAPLQPVNAGRRQVQGVQHAVELGDAAAGDDRDRAARRLRQLAQRRQHVQAHCGLRRVGHDPR
jgi:hypothetical protein